MSRGATASSTRVPIRAMNQDIPMEPNEGTSKNVELENPSKDFSTIEINY